MLVAGVDRALAHAAQEVAALVDHTKVGVDTMFRTVPADEIAFLVADAQAPKPELDEFEDAGVDVWVASVRDAATRRHRAERGFCLFCGIVAAGALAPRRARPPPRAAAPRRAWRGRPRPTGA